MFKKVIENLRKKPEHQRRLVAFWVSLIFTGLIFFVWLSFFLGNKVASQGGLPEAGLGGDNNQILK